MQCPMCGGTGSIETHDWVDDRDLMTFDETCSVCLGTGDVGEYTPGWCEKHKVWKDPETGGCVMCLDDYCPSCLKKTCECPK